MIDWLTVGQSIAALAESPERTQAALAGALAAAPRYQNTDFPLSPLPLYAGHGPAAAMVPDLEAYVALLGRIIGLYREHAEIRDWYGLGSAAESLIAADVRYGNQVQVCRLDGFLEQGTERLQLLENNADAPAGTLFSSRINKIVRNVISQVHPEPPDWSSLTCSDDMALADTLAAALTRSGLPAGNPRLAVLQFAGKSNQESQEMVLALRAAGQFAIVADPRDLQIRDGRVRFGDEPVDVCWNKVNTVGWRSAVEPDADLLDRWIRALSDASFVHVNTFGARYIAESKFTLALPRQPTFTGLFTAQEVDLVNRLLPWAQRLTMGAVAADGHSLLLDKVADWQAEFVIKEPYDIRGDGVTVGRAVSHAAWGQTLKRAVDEQLLVQRYVAPTCYPVLRAGQAPVVVAMPASFDTFVMDGQVRGFGSKASLNARLNVFQGGQKLAVHVCGEK